MRVVVVGSTAGSVLGRVIQHGFARSLIIEVVSDRDCGILSLARDYGLRSVLLPASNGADFSDALVARYRNEREIIFLSFYTRLFGVNFISAAHGRIFNCHPSILPSFKGLGGFNQTIASNALFMGCTLHQVDQEVDCGHYLIQASYPIDRTLPLLVNRHIVFLLQYYTTIQFFKWIHDNRLLIAPSGVPVIQGARYDPDIFSPNLDDDLLLFA